jgi:hypothetical protein
VGVSQLTERIVRETFGESPSLVMSEAGLIALIKRASPGMIDKSIQGALYKLAQTGKLTRHGKRGSYSYSAVDVDQVMEPTQVAEVAHEGRPNGSASNPISG